MDKKNLIQRATIAYYAMNDPIMTDAEYDSLFDNIYGDTTSPFELYQSIFTGDGRKRDLSKPMLSLRKARTQKEVESWVSKMGDKAVINLSPKYDGLACLVEVSDGKIISAVTRGNGSVGEDVTYAVSSIPGVDILDNGLHQVEVCMSTENMVLLNEEEDGRDYVHPRNAAAGLLRLSNDTIKDKASYLSIHRHFDAHAFNVTREITSTDDIAQVMENYRDDILEAMTTNGQSILLDGVVLFAHDGQGNLLTDLGDDGARPRYAVAWKFPNSAKVANIVDVHWQIGRTKNTPVATFSPPVEFDGVMVSRASLHNQDQIDRLGIQIGDQVELVRSNEVIPYVTKLHRKGENRTPIPPEPVNNEISTDIQLSHMMKVLDVRGAGDTVVSDLSSWIDLNYPKTGEHPSIYVLTSLKDMLDQGSQVFFDAVNSFGDKSSRKFCDELEKKFTEADMRLWFASIGIPGIGRRMMGKLFDHYNDASSILSALKDDSDISVEGFGKERINLLTSYTSVLANITEIVSTKVNTDVSLLVEDSQSSRDQISNGVIVVTGKIDGWTRKQIEEELSNRGWDMGSSVTSDTSVLFNASGKQSSKTTSAEKKGIPVISVKSMDDIISWVESH